VGKKEEDITLDFSWINTLFSKSKNKENKKNKVFDTIIIIILLLIPLFLSIHIRSLPAQLQIAEEWGRNSIYNMIQNDISAQINNQYPNLPQENRQVLINQEFNRQVAQNNAQIEQYVEQQAEMLRQWFRDENGETYLGDIDSYYFLRYARNIIETGDIADERRDGEPYDTRMMAPNGVRIDINIYPYIEAWVYKFVKLFNPSFSLMSAGYYTPMFLSFLAIIAAFLLGKKISGNLAGFIAAILVSVNPMVLSRTLGSDNDMINIIFPLVIMLFVFYAFDSKNYKNTTIFAAITGFLIGIYSFAWSGWWFMFLFIIGTGFLYIGYVLGKDFIKTKKLNIQNQNLKRIFLLLGIFLLTSYISLSFFGNQDLFLRSFRNPLRIIRLHAASKGVDIWPNVYRTVAEMNPASIGQIVSTLGENIYLVLAFLGTLFTLMNFKKENKIINAVYLVSSFLYFMILVDFGKSNTINLVLLLFMMSLPMFAGLLISIIFDYEINPTHSLLMTIWFVSTIYAATQGVRFIILIVPAFAVSFGILLGETVQKLSEWIGDMLELHKAIPKIIGIIIVMLVLIQPIKAGIETGYRYVPSINDAWVDTLTKIRLESSSDSIITSWWDFGHWFKYWADRRVTFDGASQNSHHAHWVGKILLTDSEEQAMTIQRMLDCGGNKAEVEIHKILENDSLKTVNFVYSLFSMSRESAEAELLKLTDDEKTQEILNYLYCEPPENYFITSGDMVGKSGVWAHFGSWDFERASLYKYYTEKDYSAFIRDVSSDFAYTEEKARSLYYELSANIDNINNWIAPWPSYGGQIGCSRNSNDTLLCTLPPNIPLLINLTSKEAYVSVNSQIFYPNSFSYVEENNFNIKHYPLNQIGYSIGLLPNNNVIFMSPELAGSMFTRLFYYEGIGLDSFYKFSDMTDVTGTRIIAWKLNRD
jgi:dolichyl-phosphooligosaccharide-protein glycotransferase